MKKLSVFLICFLSQQPIYSSTLEKFIQKESSQRHSLEDGYRDFMEHMTSEHISSQQKALYSERSRYEIGHISTNTLSFATDSTISLVEESLSQKHPTSTTLVQSITSLIGQHSAEKPINLLTRIYCLHKLTEKILDNCEEILLDPYHDFMQTRSYEYLKLLAKIIEPSNNDTQKTTPNSFPNLKLIFKSIPENLHKKPKDFNSLKKDPNKYNFLKTYRFLIKYQSQEHYLPPHFTLKKFLESDTFDHLFEHNCSTPELQPKIALRHSETIHILTYLANHIDFFHSLKQHAQTSED